MRFVSPLLKHALYPALHYSGWLDRIMPSCGYAVVTPTGYSGGEPFLDGSLVHQQTLRQQLQFLKTHYHILHPEEFRDWIEHGRQLPARSVLVTCDDGLANTLTDMLPVLESESVSCLFLSLTPRAAITRACFGTMNFIC
jgi:hypothetical protein